MAMKRPATIADFKELVNQAIYEVDDLRAAVEFDEEFMEGALNFVDILEEQLKTLHRSIKDDSYVFVNEDLPFMAFVKEQSNLVLPFKGLLTLINSTHRRGLEKAED
ncbi:MAG: general secretion pathway protein GspF [Gammaproteobacteria bacterium]|nr:general secretion pathway protein GspF [Gammaproteobacteria bacterium]